MQFLSRLWAMIVKEALQLRRDRLTFGMMFGIPIMQLVLFGFAINADPKALPAAMLSSDHTAITRSLISAIVNTGYFQVIREAASEREADELLQRGEVQFVITVPDGFTRKLIRREQAQIAVEADATDPSGDHGSRDCRRGTSRNADARTGTLGLTCAIPSGPKPRRCGSPSALQPGKHHPLQHRARSSGHHPHYDHGDDDGPCRDPRIRARHDGKIAPYIIIGAVQVAVVLAAARLLFDVPFAGSIALFGIATLLFITVNLAIGFTFSTIARNQLQAMQMSFFFLMPSILLSGFAFPFRGMPGWAQVIGEILPATHFLRIVRGLMLKAAELNQVAGELAVLALMLILVSTVAVARYRVTLD